MTDAASAVDLGTIYQDILSTEHKQFQAILRSNQMQADKKLRDMNSKSQANKDKKDLDTKTQKRFHYNIEIGKKLAETQVKQLQIKVLKLEKQI